MSAGLKQNGGFCIMQYTSGDYSRHYITEALFRLMEDNPFNEITISDVAKKAGVGRATFYRYFNSKEDVLKFFFDRAQSEFASEQIYRPRCKEDYLDVIKRVLIYIKKYKQRLQLLAKAHLEYIYLDYVDRALSDLFKNEIDDDNRYKAAGYAGAISNITLHWIKSDCKDDEETVLQAFSCIALGGFGD